MMAWIYLVFAGLFEMVGVLLIHVFHQRKNRSSALLMLLGFATSFGFLTLALRDLPMGTTYAIWTGIGAAGAATFGMIFHGESRDPKRIFFIFLIVASVVGMKIAS